MTPSSALQQTPAPSRRGETEMIAALHARRLQVVYQPQYTLPGLQLTGFEALVRLQIDPDHCVAPEHFLPLAHAAGLMGVLTLHVLESACRSLRRWRDAGHSPVFVAVNVESEDLADIRFGPRVCRLLAEYRVVPGELELELVERRSLPLGDSARINIAMLRTAGVRFAMDDFGTGHSALSLLTELPFDIVKIDKAFLARIPADAVACTLMTSVINMCLALRKEVVVEGVESDAQLRWLARLRWHWVRVQGNRLSVPLAESEACARIPLAVQEKKH